MMNIRLHSNRSYLTLRLVFWRFMASLAEHAIHLRPKVQPLVPFFPLVGYGSIAYLFGWGVGELLKTIIG